VDGLPEALHVAAGAQRRARARAAVAHPARRGVDLSVDIDARAVATSRGRDQQSEQLVGVAAPVMLEVAA
jgi:hypothetical protein